jgi:hypothetical protein
LQDGPEGGLALEREGSSPIGCSGAQPQRGGEQGA